LKLGFLNCLGFWKTYREDALRFLEFVECLECISLSKQKQGWRNEKEGTLLS
jgi:hypothetical protein